MMNMQYAIENEKVYVIEANLCESLESLGLKDKKIPYYEQKKVARFRMLPEFTK